jgi:antitoxin component YwqK of YwqJK toxin-antitoxin module
MATPNGLLTGRAKGYCASLWALCLLLCVLLLEPVAAQAQVKKDKGKTANVPRPGDKPLIYEDTLESDKRKVKVKKIPKKTFYGIKTKKAFTKVISGKKRTYEIFYVLKKPQDPDPYVRDIYWYHTKKRKVMVGPIPPKEKSLAKLLHGPYEKTVNKTTVETGQFYVGTKTGRWETVTPTEEEILTNKQKYYKGWPKEAKISYFDAEKTKVEEVLPMENGELHGEYFKFYPSGQIAENGKYEFGKKVGVWREYYPDKKKLKLETQYGPDGFTEFEPYKLKEFDAKGLVLYDKAAEDKKAGKK